MRKEMYPAIFSSDGSGGYTISFPDLLGCVTEGDTLALYLYSLSEDKEEFPVPMSPMDIQFSSGEFIGLVKWDEEAYLRKTDNRAVKKTLTIPSWLNHKAEEENLNFSKILQSALKQELGII